MAEMGKWGGYTFEVSSSLIHSFTDLAIKGSAETSDKSSGGHKYVSRKNGNPFEVSFTAVLDVRCGLADVRGEAVALAGDAYTGKTDYIVIAGQQLFACKFMLTQTDVSDIELLPSGTWLSCKVKLTFKQASKNEDGSTSSSSSSSKGGSSSKKTSAKSSSSSSSSSTKWDPWAKFDDERTELEKESASTAKSAAKKTVDTAKKTSSTKKYTPNKEFWASMAEKVKK